MDKIIGVTRAEPGVVVIRIDNPPTNALGAAPRARLHEVLDQIEGDLSVRAVVPVSYTHLTLPTILRV